MFDLTLVTLLMLATVAVLWLDAPRQAGHLAVRTPPELRPATEPASLALGQELCSRLRLAALGGGIGVVLAAVPLFFQIIFGERPETLTVVASVLSSAVVTAVATEAVDVLRRTPRPTRQPRAAMLTPRSANDVRVETVAELALAALAISALALGISLLGRGIDGAAGAVGAAAGALVVVVVCAAVRSTFVRHPLAATTTDELSVRAAAAAVTRDRFSENLVASGGVLTLVALLGPTTFRTDADQTLAVVLAAATLGAMAVLVITRRARRTSVPA